MNGRAVAGKRQLLCQVPAPRVIVFEPFWSRSEVELLFLGSGQQLVISYFYRFLHV